MSLTLVDDLGAGGVLDDTYVSIIPVSEYMAAQAIPHAGTLLLPQTMEYANGGCSTCRLTAHWATARQTTARQSRRRLMRRHRRIAVSSTCQRETIALRVRWTLTLICRFCCAALGSKRLYLAGRWNGAVRDSCGARRSTAPWFRLLLPRLAIENIGFFNGNVAGVTAIEIDGTLALPSSNTVIRDRSFRDFSICVHIGVTTPYSIDPVTIEHCQFMGNYETGVKIQHSQRLSRFISTIAHI